MIARSALCLALVCSTIALARADDRASKPAETRSLKEAQAQPSQVRALNLHGQDLSSVADPFGAFTDLEHLGLRKTKLAALPASVPTLRKLTWMDISQNGMTALPPELGRLSQLTELYASDNALVALPPEIGSLTRLRYLNLDRNKLTALPETIEKLTALEWLRLNSNELTALPAGLARMKSLKRLYIRGNKFSPETLAGITNSLKGVEVVF